MFLHLAGALMEHFFEGIAQLRQSAESSAGSTMSMVLLGRRMQNQVTFVAAVVPW